MVKKRKRTALESIQYIEKKKLIKRTAFISSICSIILFCLITYNGYQWIRYKECFDDNMILYMYDEGKIDAIEVKGDTLLNNQLAMYTEGEMTYIVDKNNGFSKVYRNNILMTMYIDNPLADFVSYFNPVVWFGGSRNVNLHQTYEIRSEEEYLRLQQVNSYDPPFTRGNEYIKLEDEVFIN